jgi:hypothetical protein
MRTLVVIAALASAAALFAQDEKQVQDAIKGLIGGDGDKRTKPSELIERLLKKE